MYKKLTHEINFSLFFFFIFSFYYSQEIPDCMKEDVENLTYISCGFHTTIMKTVDGFQVFGEDASSSGFNSLFYPTDITPANGFNYKGKIIAATLGDQYDKSPRMFILTTEGLYTWGGVNVTLSSSLIPNKNFQKISLPAGILSSDVKKMEASYAALVLLTNTGDVYVLGRDTSLFGDGSTNVTIWHKVNGISKVKFISTADAVIFAYTENGNYYTWGANTFLGDNTASGQKKSPTLMIPPFIGVPKMIVVGAFGAYLVLGPDKRIYALGNNDSGQLGIGTTLNPMNWQTVKATAQSPTPSGYLENITFINTTNNHSDSYYQGASGAIDVNGVLYLWGSNSCSMISNAASNPQTQPVIPSGFTPGVNKAIYVENGGHITPYVDIKLEKYGYVGHKIAGSMGDGFSGGVIDNYDLENTSPIKFCFIDMYTYQKCNKIDFSLNISESNYTIQWNFGDGSSIETETNTPNKTHTYAHSGTYTVTATILYDNNQSKVITKIIGVTPKPIINLGPDQILRPGTSATLDAKNPGSTYLWNTGATTQTINVTTSGTYSVTVTDVDGCINTDEVQITVRPGPVVDLGPDQNICEGTSITLDAKNPGATYLWSTGATTQTISVTTPGLYSVTVTDANGYVNTDEIEITVRPKPEVDLGPDRSICEDTYETLDAWTGSPWGTYLWSTGDTTRGIQVNTSGLYSVTVTDTNGCVTTDEVRITVLPTPVVDLGPDQTICEGTPVILDAQNPGATYHWSTGENTQTISVTTSNDYFVTVTNANGCTNIGEVEITVNPKPIVDLGPDQTICEGTAVILDAKNPGATYLWNTGATTQTISVTTSGTYSVTVTNANGCATTDEVQITVTPKPVVDLGHDQTICQDSSVTLDAKNPGATYLWNTGATTQTISVSTSGTYSVTVTDANGYTATDEVKVTVNPKPVVDLGPDQTVCEGTAVILDAKNPGATYLWNIGATTRTINVTISGTYSVTVTNANGCVSTDEVEITITPKPVVNLGPDQTICEGTTLTLNAWIGDWRATYLWNTGATTNTITVTTPGTYSVTVTDANGCTNTDEVRITTRPAAVVDLGPDQTICEGTTVTLDAKNPGATYLWNTGATTQTINVTTSGSYSVTVTDANGCVNTNEVQITVRPGPVVDLGPDQTVCEGTAVTLDAKNSGATYLWNTGATTQTISVTASGTYSVTVTNANGCATTDEVQITVTPKPVVDLGPDQTICEGTVVTLDANNPGATYLWNTGATTKTITVTASGTYSVTVTNANGCATTDEVQISVNPKPVVDLGPDQTVCVGTAVILDAKNPGATYLWNTGATTQTISVTTSGTYLVTVTDANGCTATDQVQITVLSKPVVDLGPDQTICEGTSVTLDAKNPGATYLWNTGATTQTISVTTSGTYSVTVTTANGCTATDEVQVIVNPKPIVDLGPNQTICEGVSVTLDAKNPGATYLWNTGATTQTISVTTSGTYSVTVTTANGCTASDEVQVTVNPKPVVDLGPDQTICEGASVTLDAKNPGATYRWNTGATTQTISVTTSGTYSVTVTNANGCTSSDEVKIIVKPKLIVDLGPDQTICEGASVTLDAKNPGATYRWNTGATTQTISVATSGTYSVTVTDANGCSTTSSVKINFNNPFIKEVKVDHNTAEVVAVGIAPLQYSLDKIHWQSSPVFHNLSFKVYNAYVRNTSGCISEPYPFGVLDVPNVITPNGDGINEIWNLKGLELYPESSIKIFDRYGKLLVNTKVGKGFAWDGKYLGKSVPTSTYWYIIELTDGRKLTGWLVVRNYNEKSR